MTYLNSKQQEHQSREELVSQNRELESCITGLLLGYGSRQVPIKVYWGIGYKHSAYFPLSSRS